MRRSARNFGSQLIGFLVSFGDRIFLVGLLIRSWGTDGYADWAATAAAAGLVTVSEFGFQILHGNRLSAARAKNDTAALALQLGLALAFYGGLAGFLLMMLLVTAGLVDWANLLSLHSLTNSDAAAIFIFLALQQTSRIVRGGLTQLYRSHGEFHRGVLLEAGVTAATICVAFGSVAAGASPVLIAFVYLTMELVLGWAVIFVDTRLRYSEDFKSLRLPTYSELRNLPRELGWYALIQGLPTAWAQLPVVLLAVMGIGGAALSGFIVQRTLINFGRTLSALLSLGGGVELAALLHGGSERALFSGVDTLARVNAALAGLLAGGTLAFAGPTITMWTGRSDLYDPLILLLLLCPAMITAAAVPLAMLSMLAELPHASAVSLAAQVVVGVPLAVAGAVLFGAVGVAASIAVAECLAQGLLLPILAARHFKIAYARLWTRGAVITLLAAVVSGGGGVLLVANVGLELGVSLVIWSVLIAGPTVLLSLPKSTRAQIIRHVAPKV